MRCAGKDTRVLLIKSRHQARRFWLAKIESMCKGVYFLIDFHHIRMPLRVSSFLPFKIFNVAL
jgi:hypothetical protein